LQRNGEKIINYEFEVRMDKSKYEKHLTSVLKDWNKKQHDIIIFCDPFF